MTKYYAKSASPEQKERDPNSLPTDRPVAVYYRQSSERQIGNEQTREQKEDLPKQLEAMGWSPECIAVIDDDQAVSGTLDIHERIGMTRLTEMIRRREIGAVAIISENRAFRDKFADQAAIFVRLCAENHVSVIAPKGTISVYHFDDPHLGEIHRQIFLEACKEGYRYIKLHIRGKMHAAKRARALRGLYTGGTIPAGFMVDLSTKKLAIFELAAAVIRIYFALFLHYRGNLGRTARHIRENGPDLPNFNDPTLQATLPKKSDGTPKFKLRRPFRMNKRNGRFYPTTSGLALMFTNPIYIGHSVVSEWEHYISERGKKAKRLLKTTIIENSHDPIVDRDVFEAAFNYLSKTILSGDPNPNYQKPYTARPKQSSDPRRASAPRPALEGMILSPDTQGCLRPVGISWSRAVGYYTYAMISYDEKRGGYAKRLWNVQADRLDGAVHAMLRKSLPEQLALIKAHKFREDFDAQREHWHGMIKVAEKEIAGAKMRWENSEHPDLVRDAEASYKAAKTAKAAYEAKLAQIDALEAERDKIDVLKDRLDSLITQIEMTPEDQRLLFQLCLKEIQVYSEGNDLRIRAVYHDGSTLDRIFSRHPTDWTAPECKLLTTLVAQGATPLEIAAHFPFRTWQAIRAKNKSLSGVWLSIADCPIQMGETFEDYHNRTHPEPFTPEEIEEILCSIVTNSTLGTSDSYSGRILCLTCLS